MAVPKSHAVIAAEVEGFAAIEHPAEVVYSYDFEAGAGGWRAFGVAATIVDDGTGNDAVESQSFYYPGGDIDDLGMESGRDYTIAYRVRPESDTTARVYGSAQTPVAAGVWTSVVSHITLGPAGDLTFSVGTGEALWDDITITRDAWTEYVPTAYPLDLLDASVTLDEGRTPYVEARLTAHAPNIPTLEALDPRIAPRVQITAELSWDEPTKADQTRTFDLLLHERSINHADGTVDLICESDEALLIDGGNATATVDDGAEAHDSSLRAIVDYVLDKHDAELEAGTDDADFTITSNATNLIPNPSAEVNTAGWLTSTTNAALTRQSTVAKFGTYSFRSQATASTAGIGMFADTGSIAAPYPVTVQEGKTYTWGFWAYTTLSGKSVDARIRWANGSSNVGSDTVSSTVALTPSTWTYIELTATAPATANNCAPWMSASGGFVSGNQMFFDGCMFVEGDTAPDYFDGSSSDAYYSYAWTGTAHDSASTRTRLDDRDPDVLKQEPGETDWDFLDPLIRTAGLRLFCDEQRRWYLVPSAHTIDGTVTVSEGANATQGRDTISLQATRPDGSPVWYSGAVVKYTWTDSAGAQQTRYDAAGTAEKVATFTVSRPYPGPGEAASRLALATGRGRVQDLEALSDLTATPGMTVVSSLPATPTQVGVVSAVTWYWSAEGDRHDLMDIRSRGLIDTPDTAWLFQPDGYAWEDVPTGQDWTEYTTP